MSQSTRGDEVAPAGAMLLPAASHGNPKIPQDVNILILEYLFDDVAALKACILSSRVWLPSIRPLLFRRITLRDASCYDRLRALVQAGYGPLVRDLGLSPDDASKEQLKWLGMLESLTPLLPHVTRLLLEDFCITDAPVSPGPYIKYFAPLNASLRRVLSASFRSVRTLSLDGIRICDGQQWAQFLDGFPELMTVEMDNVMTSSFYPGDGLYTPPEALRLPHTAAKSIPIRSLTFVKSNAKDCAGNILLPMTRLKLQRLCWICEPTRDSQLVLGSILAKSASVANLQVQLIGTYSGEYEYVPMALDNVRLTDVVEVLLAMVCHERPGPMIQWCPRLLAGIDSSKLGCIAFHLALLVTVGDKPQNIPPLDWVTIDSELLRLQTRSPGMVVAFCAYTGKPPSGTWISAFLGEIAHKLPNANARGVPICFRALGLCSKLPDDLRIEDFYQCTAHWAPRYES